MSTNDDALIEAMIDAASKANPHYDRASFNGMRAALAVARKAILEEAAGMVERSYDGACYEGISRFIAADIRSLNEAKP
jgi:hypothetical protein